MQLQTKYLTNLTALRGIAALMVAAFHFEELIGRFVLPEQSMIIRKGYLMVDLFFVMSGFIMLHVYGKSFSKVFQWKVFIKFLRARFARLYPLHLFTLLLVIAFFYLSHQRPNPIYNPAAIPTHLFLLHSFGIHPVFTWNIPSWSISAEWWSYIIFPFLVLFITKNKVGSVIVMALFSIAIYISIEYLLPRTNFLNPGVPVDNNLDVTWDYGFLRGLAGFIAGMLTYKMYENKTLHYIFSKDVTGFLCIAITVILLHAGVNDIFYMPAFVLLVLSTATNKKILHRIFNLKILQYPGQISYSIYMIHSFIIFLAMFPIIQAMGFVYKGPGSIRFSFITGAGLCLLFLAIVVGVSSLSYYYIEKPCRNWINKKWISKKSNPVYTTA